MGAGKTQAIQTGYLHKRSDNFGKIPAELMHDKTVTEGAKVLYAHMHWRYGSNCDNHEGRASMGEFLGVSETTITNRINELEARDWVVVKFRSDDRGRTSNEYHVFEIQVDCQDWRKEQNIVKPEIKVKPRKVRSGVGGRKTHKPKDGSETQVKVGIETQVKEPTKLELSIPLNSSSANPDSYDPDSVIHTSLSEVASAPPTVAEPVAPSKPSINQGLKDAIAINVEGIAPNEGTALTGLLANKAAAVWKRKLKVAGLTAENYASIARSIPSFVSWFKTECENCDPPRDPTKFESWYAKFTSVNGKTKAQAIEDKYIPDPDNPGIKITRAQLANRRRNEKIIEADYGKAS